LIDSDPLLQQQIRLIRIKGHEGMIQIITRFNVFKFDALSVHSSIPQILSSKNSIAKFSNTWTKSKVSIELRHRGKNKYLVYPTYCVKLSIEDFVYGATDGAVTTFAVVAGVVGA
jgi:hypothetical protein